LAYLLKRVDSQCGRLRVHGKEMEAIIQPTSLRRFMVKKKEKKVV